MVSIFRWRNTTQDIIQSASELQTARMHGNYPRLQWINRASLHGQ